METVRRYRKNILTGGSAVNPDASDLRGLPESSESDWNGDGKFESTELYRENGSVVNKWNPN